MVKDCKKLVRDKIPQIIKDDGKNTVISKITDEELFKEMLVEKLKEEVILK